MSMDAEQTKSILRNVMGNYMLALGKKSKKVVVVNADLMGTCRNKSFVEAFPERSFNVGIAEQNLVSFAAGLAHEGFVPYAFSMAQFVSMRACEQVRTDVAYGNLPVRLVTTYAGVSGGISGATHWAVEDCAILSAMPNMTVLEPSDAMRCRQSGCLTFRLILTVRFTYAVPWMPFLKTGCVIVAQDHAIIGGLGSMVAHVLSEEGLGIRYKLFGIPDYFETIAYASYLYHKFGYDANGLKKEMMKIVGESLS